MDELTGAQLIARAVAEGTADGARIADQEARAGRGGRSSSTSATLYSLHCGPLRALVLARGRGLARHAGLDEEGDRHAREVYALIFAQAVAFAFLQRSISPAGVALQTLGRASLS